MERNQSGYVGDKGETKLNKRFMEKKKTLYNRIVGTLRMKF
jgi:hypothetical protein